MLSVRSTIDCLTLRSSASTRVRAMATSPDSLIRWSSVSALMRSIAAGLGSGGSARGASARPAACGAGAGTAASGAGPAAMRSTSRLRRSIFSSSSTNREAGTDSAASAASMRLSMTWVSSPSRMAPAMRALPFSVCSARCSDCCTFSSPGCAFQSRRSLPICGSRLCASSRKIGISCGSMSSRITRCALPPLAGAGAGCCCAGAGAGAGAGPASRRAVSARTPASTLPGGEGASRWEIASTRLCRPSMALRTILASLASPLSGASGIHCSSAAASEAVDSNPAVVELLASVCAARTNSRVTSPGASRHALYPFSSASTCWRASFR